jgi:hypothetical protein
MGYRSDVTIVMYPKRKEDFALLKLYADETFPDKFEVHEDNNHSEGFRYLMLEIDSIKWYEGYEEVDVYTRAFSEWDTMFRDEYEPESGTLFHYEFLRIGDDMEDIVYDQSANSDPILEVERRAYINI